MTDDNREEWEVEAIVDRRKRGRGHQLLVK